MGKLFVQVFCFIKNKVNNVFNTKIFSLYMQSAVLIYRFLFSGNAVGGAIRWSNP